MFYGIGKDISFANALLLGILLGAEHNGLAAVNPVDAVKSLVECFQLLVFVGTYVEEVLLDRTVWGNPHHDDPGFLVLEPLSEDGAESLVGCVNNGLRGARWC